MQFDININFAKIENIFFKIWVFMILTEKPAGNSM